MPVRGVRDLRRKIFYGSEARDFPAPARRKEEAHQMRDAYASDPKLRPRSLLHLAAGKEDIIA
jgi:hypothetical protein